MNINWETVDRWLMGEAFVGSCITDHITALCETIGTRWAGTENELAAAEYVASRFGELPLSAPSLEPFELKTSDCHTASLRVIGEEPWTMDARPCLFCPPVNTDAKLVDVGYGMMHELIPIRDQLAGCVALIRSEFEPFTEPRLLTLRLQDLARHGVSVAITASPHPGRRLSHVSAADWRQDPTSNPIALVQTSREDEARLRRQARAGIHVAVRVESELRSSTSWNCVADLSGSSQGNDSIVLGAHHDTTPDSLGANDNGAGVAVLLETARLLSQLSKATDVHPGKTIRFVSFGAEEQGLQGSKAFVATHYGPEPPPRFMLALDELCTGPMRGVVLQFPELRHLIQQQLDSLEEGLQCHVLAQLDASGDMFPFAQRGIQSSFLWRWRFVGRYPETMFGHSSSDTPEKIRIRELKEYAGLLARLLLRLSMVPGDAWPDTDLTSETFAKRIDAERGTVFRTM